MSRLDLGTYLSLCARLRDAGHGGDYDWAESVTPPQTPEAFACEYVWVVLNSGMKNTVARGIMDRLWPRLVAGESAQVAFGHKGKTAAIDHVWANRSKLFAELQSAEDLVTWCAALPWIGQITKWHLAKNLGADVAKPDRWLVRLAEAEGTSVDALCQRLAKLSGDRVATVDVVLWRACAVGLLQVKDGHVIVAG